MSDLFFIAAKENYTFPSVQGALAVTDLFRLPLTSAKANVANLDDVAKTIDSELEKAGEKSFVTTSASSAKRKVLEQKLEIVKTVIADKIAENEARAAATKKAEMREKVKAIIAEKQEDALGAKSVEELQELYKSLE